MKTYSLLFIFCLFSLNNHSIGQPVWQIKTQGNRNLADVWFNNNQHGVAVGALETILLTENGGENWQSVGSGIEINLNGVFFTNDSIGLTVGQGGKILRTINGGNNWELIISGTEELL